MLIFFTQPWDETKRESKDIEEVLKDIVKNYVIRSDSDIHKYLDSILDKMFGNNTRSWITTLYSSRESLNRTYFVHVHVYESGGQNVILTIALHQRDLDSLQSITAWKISKLVQSKKQLEELILIRAIPKSLKPEIERFIMD